MNKLPLCPGVQLYPSDHPSLCFRVGTSKDALHFKAVACVTEQHPNILHIPKFVDVFVAQKDAPDVSEHDFSIPFKAVARIVLFDGKSVSNDAVVRLVVQLKTGTPWPLAKNTMRRFFVVYVRAQDTHILTGTQLSEFVVERFENDRSLRTMNKKMVEESQDMGTNDDISEHANAEKQKHALNLDSSDDDDEFQQGSHSLDEEIDENTRAYIQEQIEKCCTTNASTVVKSCQEIISKECGHCRTIIVDQTQAHTMTFMATIRDSPETFIMDTEHMYLLHLTHERIDGVNDKTDGFSMRPTEKTGKKVQKKKKKKRIVLHNHFVFLDLADLSAIVMHVDMSNARRQDHTAALYFIDKEAHLSVLNDISRRDFERINDAFCFTHVSVVRTILDDDIFDQIDLTQLSVMTLEDLLAVHAKKLEPRKKAHHRVLERLDLTFASKNVGIADRMPAIVYDSDSESDGSEVRLEDLSDAPDEEVSGAEADNLEYFSDNGCKKNGAPMDESYSDEESDAGRTCVDVAHNKEDENSVDAYDDMDVEIAKGLDEDTASESDCDYMDGVSDNE